MSEIIICKKCKNWQEKRFDKVFTKMYNLCWSCQKGLALKNEISFEELERKEQYAMKKSKLNKKCFLNFLTKYGY